MPSLEELAAYEMGRNDLAREIARHLLPIHALKPATEGSWEDVLSYVTVLTEAVGDVADLCRGVLKHTGGDRP